MCYLWWIGAGIHYISCEMLTMLVNWHKCHSETIVHNVMGYNLCRWYCLITRLSCTYVSVKCEYHIMSHYISIVSSLQPLIGIVIILSYKSHCLSIHPSQRSLLHYHGNEFTYQYFNGLVQERRNSIANALELRLSCNDPSIWCDHAQYHDADYCRKYSCLAILVHFTILCNSPWQLLKRTDIYENLCWKRFQPHSMMEFVISFACIEGLNLVNSYVFQPRVLLFSQHIFAIISLHTMQAWNFY